MLILHFIAGACSLVPHVALHWSGLPFEARPESRESTRSPEYRAMNPQGLVPVLEDDGWVLTQNVAILDYLHDLVPQAGIYGRGADVRQVAQARQWLLFANTDLQQVFAAIFATSRIVENEEAQALVEIHAREKALTLFALVDQALAGREYLSGLLSVADVYLYTIMRWARLLEIDLSGYAHLAAHYQRIERDPGVLAALKAEGLL